VVKGVQQYRSSRDRTISEPRDCRDLARFRPEERKKAEFGLEILVAPGSARKRGREQGKTGRTRLAQYRRGISQVNKGV